MAFARGPKIVRDGLVLALDAGSERSYPGSGTTWKDLVYKGESTLVNGPTFNEYYITFDGIDEQAMTVNGDSIWTQSRSSTYFSSGASYSCWVYPLSTTSGYFIGTGAAFRISFTTLGFRFWDRDINAGTSQEDTGLGSPSINNWYNIVGVLNPSTQEKLFYINGEVVNTNTSYTRTPSMGTTQMSLGRGYPYGSTYYNCRISNTLIYNVALTAQEVQQNYNATKGRFGL